MRESRKTIDNYGEKKFIIFTIYDSCWKDWRKKENINIRKIPSEAYI